MSEKPSEQTVALGNVPDEEEHFESERPTLVDAFDRISLPVIAAAPRNRPLLRILTGPDRGRVHRLPDGIATLGRANVATVMIMDQGLSRIHANVHPVPGGFILTDAGSTNGTFVGEDRIIAPTRIAPGMRFRLGQRTIASITLHDALEEEAALSVHEAALQDRLTGVYNRGVFDDRLASEIAFAHRHGVPLSLVLFDIDHFKRFNDVHGHLVGDAVLIAVGKQVQNTVRTEDTLARFGGEEFVVIARDTPSDKASILGERIRVAIEKCTIDLDTLDLGPSSSPQAAKTDSLLRVTASVGVSTLSAGNTTMTAEALISLADKALYAAKQAGRNQTLHADALPPASG